MTSDDNGETWTAQNGPTGSLLDVCWASDINLLCAVGDNCIWTSPTGLAGTWTSRTPAAANEVWVSVVRAVYLAKFITVSATQTSAAVAIGSSSDGITWVSKTASGNKKWQALAVSEVLGTVVAVARETGGDLFMSSEDGNTWTGRTPPHSEQWRSVVRSETRGRFVAVGEVDECAYSTDGHTWVTGGDPTDGVGPFALAEHNGTIVGVGGEDVRRVIISIDGGTSWFFSRSSLTGITRGALNSVAVTHAINARVGEVIYIAPAHPADIVLARLQNTDKSGASISASLIDIVGIGTTLKNDVGASYTMTFIVESAQNLKTWLETEIYLPLQWYQVPSAGKYSVHRSSLPSAPVATISHDDIISNGGQVALNWDDNFRTSVINFVVYQYDFDEITGQFKKTSAPFQDATSVANGKAPLIISSKGLKVRLAGTQDLISTVANNIIARYRWGAPLIRSRVFLQKNLLEPGDIIALTTSLLPNPDTLARGLTGQVMEVLNRGIVFDQGYVDLTLIWAAWKANAIPAGVTVADIMAADSSPRNIYPAGDAARYFWILPATGDKVYRSRRTSPGSGSFGVWEEMAIPAGNWARFGGSNTNAGQCLIFGTDAFIASKLLLSGADPLSTVDEPWVKYAVPEILHGEGGLIEPTDVAFWTPSNPSTTPLAAINGSTLYAGLSMLNYPSSTYPTKYETWGGFTNALPAGTWNKILGANGTGSGSGGYEREVLMIGTGTNVARWSDFYNDNAWVMRICPDGDWKDIDCDQGDICLIVGGPAGPNYIMGSIDFFNTFTAITPPSGYIPSSRPRVVFDPNMYNLAGGDAGTFVITGVTVNGISSVVLVPVTGGGAFLTPIVATLPSVPSGAVWTASARNFVFAGHLIVGTANGVTYLLSNPETANAGTAATYDDWEVRTLSQPPFAITTIDTFGIKGSLTADSIRKRRRPIHQVYGRPAY
jgi:hypothetical protein